MLTEFLTVYLFGSALYGGIELLYRGYTHWTMLVLGGLCFSVMYLLSGTALPFMARLVLSALSITVLELGTGCVVNIILGWHVWDYSSQPLNFLGQICPVYSFIWLLLSVPGMSLCRFWRRALPVLFKAPPSPRRSQA